MVLIIVRKDKF